jgi:hypothetical protein
VIHQSLLRYRGARYLWWSLGLVVACWALYLTQGRLQPANGGTWQGYVLGTIGALLIVWLALLGIRKRRYSSTVGSVQGWASAHIYLGTGLIAIATLHCAAQFGWNIHTLAYALMCIVIVSGFYGVFTYLTHPTLIARNREGGVRAQLFAELFDLDRQARALAKKCDPAVTLAVDSSIERTAIGGTVVAQILGQDRSWFLQSATRGGTATLTGNKDQQPAIDFVAARLPRADKSAEAANLQQLVVILCRRQAVLRRIRRDVRLQGLLKAWIYVHVPLTIALIGALIAHIVSTFLYW